MDIKSTEHDKTDTLWRSWSLADH